MDIIVKRDVSCLQIFDIPNESEGILANISGHVFYQILKHQTLRFYK